MFFINNQSVAVGYIATESRQGPYLPATYASGQFQSLGIESSSFSNIVTGINDRGDVVGNLTNPDRTQTPYVFREGSARTPALPWTAHRFSGISGSGAICGPAADPATGARFPFLFRDGMAERLPVSAPDIFHYFTDPRRISDTGLLALLGSSQNFAITRQYLYDIPAGVLREVAVPSGYARSRVSQVTGSGLVVGQVSGGTGPTRYAFWNADGSFRSFFDVPDGTTSLQVNNLGQAIGLNAGRPFFFDGASWSEQQALGLNGYTLNGIGDFNDRGQFVSLALNPQNTFLWGYVATPRSTAIPEPSAAALLALGLTGWLGYGGLRHRRWTAPRAKPMA
jgi:hypothetical protein